MRTLAKQIIYGIPTVLLVALVTTIGLFITLVFVRDIVTIATSLW
jgi:hypothetical protein